MKKLLLTLFLLSQLLANAQRTGKDYAVFFTAYTFDNNHWGKLPKVPAETELLADDLRDIYGFDVRMVSNATRADILRTLGEYKQKTYGPDDQLLLYFSMHGYHDPASDKGYLIPKDGLYDDPTYESWIAHSQLSEIAASMRCQHILISLDACYSGIFGQNKNRPTAAAWETAPDDCATKIKKAFQTGVTRKYCAAGGDTHVPAESAFAGQWHKALSANNAADGMLSFAALTAFLTEFHDPQPVWGDFVRTALGDFVFVKKNGCSNRPDGALDSDGDDIPDKEDECPNVQGIASKKGCPGDKDGDGVPDNEDRCPDEKGFLKGCPDNDHDGVADKDDKCPEELGIIDLQGCPDQDADGVADWNDPCPNEKGPVQGCPDKDNDGVADIHDRCPDEWGPVNGCPDGDGDGVADGEDACLELAGVPEWKGCPLDDHDGDGLKNQEDMCPEELPGNHGNRGCPDDDGDGLVSIEDKCPHEWGIKRSHGCAPLIAFKLGIYPTLGYDFYQFFKVPSDYYPDESHTIGSVLAGSAGLGIRLTHPLSFLNITLECRPSFTPWGLSIDKYRGAGIFYLPSIANVGFRINDDDENGMAISVGFGYEWVWPDLYLHSDKRPVTTKKYGNYSWQIRLGDLYGSGIYGVFRRDRASSSWGFGLGMVFNMLHLDKE